MNKVLSSALNESFNGDGTVVSYLDNVRRAIMNYGNGIGVCVREPI
jgi:hypothetical protein